MTDEKSTFLEGFESCPMCGHEGITSRGCCVNCGEALLDSAQGGIAEREEAQSPNWRLFCGPIIMLAFGMLTVATIVKAVESAGRDRELFLLFGAALGCVTLIGVTLFVQGITARMRRGD
jgi:hypothetical protein